ncbi:MAG TPA: FadR/GntR family transcriptional regulator [Solirubrobacteraceae bacterium]|jgi:GntR family transcriptional repressor for pyruvate dehydrogenase complex
MAQESSASTAFQELGRRSLSRDAAEQLKRAILDGTLAPGDRLPPERELAARLGVSRPTLRGAVNALVIMGLLDSRHGSGTFVAAGAATAVPESDGSAIVIDIGDSPLVALFELRLLFEPLAVQRAAARIEQGDLDELARLLEEMEANLDDSADFVRIDAEFHEIIQNASASPLIVSVLGSISELALRGRTLSGRHKRVRERTVGEHAVILDALKRRDPFEASAAMTAHLMHIRATMIGQAT